MASLDSGIVKTSGGISGAGAGGGLGLNAPGAGSCSTSMRYTGFMRVGGDEDIITTSHMSRANDCRSKGAALWGWRGRHERGLNFG